MTTVSVRPFGLCAGEFPDPQDAADVMTREAQERGEYDEPGFVPLVPTKKIVGKVIASVTGKTIDSPLSSIPEIIEQIRKDRDEARRLLAELWYAADKCPRCCNLPETDRASKHLESK